MKNRSLDQLIKSIQDDKAGQSRGQLRIFFGYAAGVGKTYAMLKAAHAAKRRGVDVVAGFVETHGRPRTQRRLPQGWLFDTSHVFGKYRPADPVYDGS